MDKSKTVTCSFTMDRDVYNAYKGVVFSNGENVKGNLINYMKSVIQYETPDPMVIRKLSEKENEV